MKIHCFMCGKFLGVITKAQIRKRTEHVCHDCSDAMGHKDVVVDCRAGEVEFERLFGTLRKVTR